MGIRSAKSQEYWPQIWLLKKKHYLMHTCTCKWSYSSPIPLYEWTIRAHE